MICCASFLFPAVSRRENKNQSFYPKQFLLTSGVGTTQKMEPLELFAVVIICLVIGYAVGRFNRLLEDVAFFGRLSAGRPLAEMGRPPTQAETGRPPRERTRESSPSSRSSSKRSKGSGSRENFSSGSSGTTTGASKMEVERKKASAGRLRRKQLTAERRLNETPDEVSTLKQMTDKRDEISSKYAKKYSE